MRMRKKKNLDSRIESCSDLLIEIDVEEKDFRSYENEVSYIDFSQLFGNDNPVFLEIGCGKGQYSIEFVKRHPDINYIAVEKVENVIVTACENAKKENLTNLRFINCSVLYLQGFIKPQSIQRVILNFSCPYPKKRYANNRLTNVKFLAFYDKILAPDGSVWQKTDNRRFFEYSIEQYSLYDFVMKNISFDLHNSVFAEDNIITEYEQRFLSLGQPIYRLEAYKRNGDLK